MDPIQTYLSYVSAALPAPLSLRPPLTLAVDLAGLAVALMNVRARPFAPAGARRLAWLAVLVGGLAPLLLTLGPWASHLFPPVPVSVVPVSVWSGVAPGALLVALLLLGSATSRLTRSGVTRPFAAVVEGAGLLVTAAGLAGVLLPVLVTAGWVNSTWSASQVAPSAIVSWSVALAGALIVLAANASGGMGGVVPVGRRAGTVLMALAYTLLVTGITFAPGWLDGTGVWGQFALPVHVADALALLALASTTRHMLNRPAAAEYWARASTARTRQGSARARSAPKPSHIVPAVTTSRTPIQAPALTSMPRPVVPPTALAPFAPPALRRTVIYGQNATATVVTASARAANEVEAVAAKTPLVRLDELRSNMPERGNTLPGDAEHATAKQENLAPELEISPQFVTAVLTLQTEMLRAGRHYSFAELVEMFSEVRPRAGAMLPRALGRAGALGGVDGDGLAALPLPLEDDGPLGSAPR